MTQPSREQLDQLWELRYGLLSADESASLRRQLDDDPALAAAYSEVCRSADLVAQAAQVRTAPIALQLPSDAAAVPESAGLPATPVAANRKPQRNWRRLATLWTALAASVVVGVGIAGFGYHQAQIARINAEHVRLIVCSPNVYQPELGSQISVSTLGSADQPRSAEVDVKLQSPVGTVVFEERVRTDSRGESSVVVPPRLPVAKGSVLTVSAVGAKNKPFETRLAVAAARGVDSKRYENLPQREPAAFKDAADRKSAVARDGAFRKGEKESEKPEAPAGPAAGPFQFKDKANSEAKAHDSDATESAQSRGARGGKPSESTDDTSRTTSERKLLEQQATVKLPMREKSFADLPAESAKTTPTVFDLASTVIAAGEPVALTVRHPAAQGRLVAAAYQKGALVGQRAVAEASSGPIPLPLLPDIAGALKVVLFDFSRSDSQPLAERLVFRRPARWLTVTPTQEQPLRLTPGEHVELTFATTLDGVPAPAALDVAIIDESGAAGAPPRVSVAAQRLFSEFVPAGKLAEADRLLAAGATNQREFEALFAAPNPPLAQAAQARYAKAGKAGLGAGMGMIAGASANGAALKQVAESPTSRPILFDNRDAVQSALKSELDDFQSAARNFISNGATILATALLLSLAGLLMRHFGMPNRRLIGFAGAGVAGIAAIALIAWWIGPQRQFQLARGPEMAPAENLKAAKADSKISTEHEAIEEAAGSKQQAVIPPVNAKVESSAELAPKKDEAPRSAPAPTADPRPAARPLRGQAVDEKLGAKGAGRMAKGLPAPAKPTPPPPAPASAAAGADLVRQNDRLAESIAMLDKRTFVERSLRKELNETPLADKAKTETFGASAERSDAKPQPLPAEAKKRAPLSRESRRQNALRPSDSNLLLQEKFATDAAGRAVIPFDVPLHTGKFRVLIDASDDKGGLGAGMAAIVSRLPVEIETRIGGDLKPGAKAEFTIYATNQTSKPQPVKLQLEKAAWFASNDSTRQFSLKPGEKRAEKFTLEIRGPSQEVELRLHIMTDDVRYDIPHRIGLDRD